MADTNTERRKLFADWMAFEKGQQSRELEDLAFYEGEGQWPESVQDLWKGSPADDQTPTGRPMVPSSPMLTINKVREPIRHVVNEERQSDLGVEIIAADDFGSGVSPQLAAEINTREGLVRRIQRESHAIDARIWAAERATIAGRGYYGVMSRYLPGKTNDQELYIRRFYDQGSILLDPAHEEPDGSDAEGAFVPTWVPWDQYKKEYKSRAGKGGKRVDNRAIAMGEQDFKTLAAQRTDWFSTQNDFWRVRVVEYWYYERQTRGLVQLKDGTLLWDDELPKGFDRDAIQDEREVIDKRVKFCLLDGYDDDDRPLDETDWPGQYIPIIKIVGEEIQPFDAQRRFEGMVRPSIDSQRGSNYMISKLVKQVGFTPNSPLMMTPQHIEGFSDMYESMAVRAWPVLYYNAFDPTSGQQLPPPTRPPVQTDIAAAASAYQIFQEAIRSTTAVPDPSLGNVDPSVRSGKGIQALALNALKATAHFGDNFQRSVIYEGRILNDLLYPIYGTRPGRKLRLYTKERESKTVAVTAMPQPGEMQGQQPTQAPVPTDQMAVLTKDANFAVTIKVSKNYDTRREQEASTIAEAIQSAPEVMWPVFGDLYFKYQDGPGHDEYADRAKFILRPEIQAMLSGQQGVSPQVQALTAQVQQLTAMIQGKTVEQQAKIQGIQIQEQHEDARTAAEIQAGVLKTQIQATATEAVAQAKVDAENFRSYVDASEERIAKLLDMHLAKVSDQMTRTHEAVQNLQQQRHEVALEHVKHAHAMAQGEQATQSALAQNAQQAALQPPPTEEPVNG